MSYESNRHVLHSASCEYHVVFCPKYRRKVLINGVDKRLKEITVHILCEVDQQFGVHKFVKRVKSLSSRLLRPEFPHLKSRLPALWTYSYFVSIVSGAPIAILKQYIENQRIV